MTTRLVHLLIDSADPPSAATFWAQALGWEPASEGPDEAVAMPADFAYPGTSAVPLVFVPIPETKSAKNRVHLDIAPFAGDDHAANVTALQAAGANLADVGQSGNENWVVMSDPDGQEFCVLRPR